MKIINKDCFICGESNCNGIIVNGEFICAECEKNIVSTKVNDNNYDKYKDKIRVILFDQCRS